MKILSLFVVSYCRFIVATILVNLTWIILTTGMSNLVNFLIRSKLLFARDNMGTNAISSDKQWHDVPYLTCFVVVRFKDIKLQFFGENITLKRFVITVVWI